MIDRNLKGASGVANLQMGLLGYISETEAEVKALKDMLKDVLEVCSEIA